MSEFDLHYQEYVIKNNLQGKTEQEVLTHMEQSGWLTPEEVQVLRTSGAFSVGRTLTQTHTDEFQSTQNTENTQSQLAPQKIVLTEEQAQEQVISTVTKDVIDARNILMHVDHGVISKGYDKLKTSAYEIKKAGKEKECREDVERISALCGGPIGYLVSTYLYDKYMDGAEFSYSNVEENVALQAVGADNMQLAKNGQLSKKEYYLQNKEHLKTMLIRRLYMKDQKSGDSFIDRNRGNLSQEDFGKFLEDYINDMVDKLQDLDSIKTIQRGLTALSPEQTEQYYQKLLKNAKNQPPKKVGEINISIKTPEVPLEFDTEEPISFEEVFKYERGTEFSKDNVQHHIQKETDLNYVLGAYNKHQVLKNAVDEYKKDYSRQIASSNMGNAGIGGTTVEPNPTAQAEKVTKIFEEYFANPVNPNFAKEKLEEIITTNKLPILVNSSETGKLSLDLSALGSDSAKNRALNNILSLLMQEQNSQLEKIMGGNPEDRMLAYQQNYSISRDFAYGSEYSNALAEAMDNDNKTVIKRVTGDISSAGMGMTVIGGVLCFTPLAPLGATLLTAGNATAITGMVSESALGYTEALTRNDINEDELIEITKTTLMNAGGFGVGMVGGKLGMKAFGNIIDDKLATVFNQEIAMGNRAGALKAVFCDPNNLANFMQAAGAKVGTDFLISYAGDLAMMGVLGTQDDWQSLLKSNLIGIMVGMSSDIKDVSGVNGRFGSAKPKPETQSTKPAVFGAIVRNTEPETRATTQNSHQVKLDETKRLNTEPVAPKGEIEEPHAKNSSEANETQNTNRSEESKPSTSIEEMHAKIENIDIRDTKVVDEIIAEWRADMEKALDVKNNDEYRAILDYTSKKYDIFASKIEELCMDSDPEVARLAMQVLMDKLAPLAESFQRDIFSVVDNRPEIKGAYGQTVKPEGAETTSQKNSADDSNPLRPKPFEAPDAYKLTEVVSEADLTRVGSELLTTVNGKKVLTPEADVMVRNIANQIHNLALKEESGIVDIMIKMGFGTEETFRHRSKSVQSTYDKIKNALIDDEKSSLKDAVGTVFDGVGVRTVSTINNFANHPNVKKYLDAGDYKTAYQKAVELESDFVLQSLKKYVDLCAEGKNEVKLTRISNYMGEDGIPYFTEKQLQHLKAYANSKGVALPIVERVMDYTERTQAQTESPYRKKSTTKVRGSGYTALQMNFVTKDGFSYEWQYRKEKVDAFAEGEHIPYDLRTNKDIIGTHTELTRLYEPIKDLLTNKEKMPDTKFDEYNYYLTAHYEHLRLVELGLADMADAPKLPKGFDERLRAENLELIHEIAEKIKKEPHKEAEYLKEYEERLIRNTDENTTTKSYTQEAEFRAQNRTIDQNETETRLGANRNNADLYAISRIIIACKNAQGAITDRLIREAEFLMAQGVKTDDIINAINQMKSDTRVLAEGARSNMDLTENTKPITLESLEADYPNRFSPSDKEMIMRLAQENQELVSKLLAYKNVDGDYQLNYHTLPQVFNVLKSDIETSLKLLDLKDSNGKDLVDIYDIANIIRNEEATLQQCLCLAESRDKDGKYRLENHILQYLLDTEELCDLETKITLYEMKNHDGTSRFSNREVNNLLYLIHRNPELGIKLLEIQNPDGSYRFKPQDIERYMADIQYAFKDKEFAIELLNIKNSNGEYRLSGDEFRDLALIFRGKDIDPILKDLLVEQNPDGSYKYAYNDVLELYNAKQSSDEAFQTLKTEKEEITQRAHVLFEKYGSRLTLNQRTEIAKLSPEQIAKVNELLDYTVKNNDGTEVHRFGFDDVMQLANSNVENVMRLSNIRWTTNGQFRFKADEIKQLAEYKNMHDVIYLANIRRSQNDNIEAYSVSDIQYILEKGTIENVRVLTDLSYNKPNGDKEHRFDSVDTMLELANLDIEKVLKIADVYWTLDGEPRFNNVNDFKRLVELENLDDVLRVLELKSHHPNYTEYRWGINDCIEMVQKDYNNLVDILNIEFDGKKVFTMDGVKLLADYKASDINALAQIKQTGSNEAYLNLDQIKSILDARKESNSDIPIDFFAEQFEYYLNLKTKSGKMIFDGRKGRMNEFDVINYMANLPEASKEATSMRMLTQMVQDEVVSPHMLKYMPQEGKLNPLISEEIQLFFDAYLNNIPFRDVLVPNYSSVADASANVKSGDVFSVEGEYNIYIKNEDGTATQLEIGKGLYCYLFPPIERYTTTQNAIGNCWQINGFNSILRDPRERINLLKCFKQDGDDIIVKFPNGKLDEIRFVNGKLPAGSDLKYYSEGAYGINFLEYAQAKEMQKTAIDAVVNELTHQISIAKNEYDLEFYTKRLTTFTQYIETYKDRIFIDRNGHLIKDKIDFPEFDLAITEYREGGCSNTVWELLGYEKTKCLCFDNSGEFNQVQLLLDSPELFDEHIVGWASAGSGEKSIRDAKGIVSGHAYWLKQNLDDNGNVINYSVLNPWGILETTLTRDEVIQFGKAFYVGKRE